MAAVAELSWAKTKIQDPHPGLLHGCGDPRTWVILWCALRCISRELDYSLADGIQTRTDDSLTQQDTTLVPTISFKTCATVPTSLLSSDRSFQKFKAWILKKAYKDFQIFGAKKTNHLTSYFLRNLNTLKVLSQHSRRKTFM